MGLFDLCQIMKTEGPIVLSRVYVKEDHSHIRSQYEDCTGFQSHLNVQIIC